MEKNPRKLDEEIFELFKSNLTDDEKIEKIREQAEKEKEMSEKVGVLSEKMNILSELFRLSVIDEISEAIKSIKIEPKINVEPPKVFVQAPEPKVIVRESPPVVVPSPKVILQERPFPEEMKVTGIMGFFKSVVDAIKGKLSVVINDNTPANPLYITPAYGGQAYKLEGQLDGKNLIIGSGGPSRVWLKNKDNQTISPVAESGTPYVYNVELTNVNIEYSQALPDHTRSIKIKTRALNAILKFSFVSGESGTNYITVPYGVTYPMNNINLSGATLYFQTASSGTPHTCEIEAWV